MSRQKWKKWTALEEKQLKALLEKKMPIRIIGETIGHSPESVMVKMGRLGLVVAKTQFSGGATTSVEFPKEMVDLDRTMLLLGGALERVAEGGLTIADVRRLSVLAGIAKTYKELLVNYINYAIIEKRLFGLDEKCARLVKGNEKSSNTPAGYLLVGLVFSQSDVFDEMR
jgi:hypothetical protein